MWISGNFLDNRWYHLGKWITFTVLNILPFVKEYIDGTIIKDITR